jgi:hypothetical protein
MGPNPSTLLLIDKGHTLTQADDGQRRSFPLAASVKARTRLSAAVRERAQRRGKERTGEGKDEPSADRLRVADMAGTASLARLQGRDSMSLARLPYREDLASLASTRGHDLQASAGVRRKTEA